MVGAAESTAAHAIKEVAKVAVITTVCEGRTNSMRLIGYSPLVSLAPR
jgi:hypothetical protein